MGERVGIMLSFQTLDPAELDFLTYNPELPNYGNQWIPSFVINWIELIYSQFKESLTRIESFKESWLRQRISIGPLFISFKIWPESAGLIYEIEIYVMDYCGSNKKL